MELKYGDYHPIPLNKYVSEIKKLAFNLSKEELEHIEKFGEKDKIVSETYNIIRIK